MKRYSYCDPAFYLSAVTPRSGCAGCLDPVAGALFDEVLDVVAAASDAEIAAMTAILAATEDVALPVGPGEVGWDGTGDRLPEHARASLPRFDLPDPVEIVALRRRVQRKATARPCVNHP